MRKRFRQVSMDRRVKPGGDGRGKGLMLLSSPVRKNF